MIKQQLNSIKRTIPTEATQKLHSDLISIGEELLQRGASTTEAATYQELVERFHLFCDCENVT